MSDNTFHAWERPSTPCAGRAQPGSAALLKALIDIYGESHGASSFGIYVCRNVRGRNSPSMHGDGRALDLKVPTGDGGKSALKKNYEIVENLVKNAGPLGLQFLVFDRKKWGKKYSLSGDYYGGAHPHHDHLHVEQTRAISKSLTYDKARSLLDPKPPKVYDQAVIVSTTVDHQIAKEAGFAAERNLAILALLDQGRLVNTVDGTDAAVGSWAMVVGGLALRRVKEARLKFLARDSFVGETRVETREMVEAFGRRFPADEWKRRGDPTV